MKTSELEIGQSISGLVPDSSVEIISVSSIALGSAVVVVKRPNGEFQELIVNDEMSFELTLSENFKFDADPASFKLAMEATRMELAGVFDPFAALSTSNLKPLPHQLSAVYGELLNKIPLRFLLADEPGAGKTIMAGLLIKELILRGSLKRCLIVCPGSLGEQWSDELKEKFGLSFRQLNKNSLDEASHVNPFNESNFMIARMDQLARSSDQVKKRLEETDWDLVIIDEAHRMSAQHVGFKNEASKTLRFQLGQLLSKQTTHMLLMTATPHTGSDENFHLFLSLLDGDMFAGNLRQGESKADFSPVMLRRVKENLVTFEGNRLFPPRKAITVSYELSSSELELYDQVTAYVKEEMARAMAFYANDKKKQGNVSFALTVLQRRLASSPLAIRNSLQRRLEKLKSTTEGAIGSEYKSAGLTEFIDEADEIFGEFSDEQRELLEESEAVIGSTAATSVSGLNEEVSKLESLVKIADKVLAAENDSKWIQLKSILESENLSGGENDEFEKLIIFTEHRDTLEYLKNRIAETLGPNYKVVTIHGGNSREERRRSQAEFTHNPMAPILVATDAAGEGINLQRAHLMVNYDLPWNPNRIEQRFGRIHRIGQLSECTLWNLVSANTREGSVYLRLLKKIVTQGEAYNGNLFHILGGDDLFEGKSLADLLTEAITGSQTEVEAELDLGLIKASQQAQHEAALMPEIASTFDASEIARRMNEAKARRLAPGFVAGFFAAAFKDFGGSLQDKESERYKITNVPALLNKLSKTDKSIGELSSQYERVTFKAEYVQLEGAPDAELIAPGSPLMNAVVKGILNQYSDLLGKGTLFIDENTDAPEEVRMLVCLSQELVNNFDQAKPLERIVVFAEVLPSGETFFYDTPPFFDFELPDTQLQEKIRRELISGLDFTSLVETGKKVLSERTTTFRLPELKAQVAEQLEKTRTEVIKRMDQEIKFWDNEATALAQGTKSNLKYTAANAKAKANDHRERKLSRLKQIEREGTILIKPPQVLSVSLIVPSSLVSDEEASSKVVFAKDQEAIKKIERRAVDLVLAVEKKLGFKPKEMPRNNPGFDIDTYREYTGRTFIEVKGRIDGAEDFIITETEFSHGHTQGDSFILALVKVAPGDDATKDQIRYIIDPFKGQLPIWGAKALVLSMKKFWEMGFDPLID